MGDDIALGDRGSNTMPLATHTKLAGEDAVVCQERSGDNAYPLERSLLVAEREEGRLCVGDATSRRSGQVFSRRGCTLRAIGGRHPAKAAAVSVAFVLGLVVYSSGRGRGSP